MHIESPMPVLALTKTLSAALDLRKVWPKRRMKFAGGPLYAFGKLAMAAPMCLGGHPKSMPSAAKQQTARKKSAVVVRQELVITAAFPQMIGCRCESGCKSCDRYCGNFATLGIVCTPWQKERLCKIGEYSKRLVYMLFGVAWILMWRKSIEWPDSSIFAETSEGQILVAMRSMHRQHHTLEQKMQSSTCNMACRTFVILSPAT